MQFALADARDGRRAVNGEGSGWLGRAWERLSTGIKMLAILSLGLLPLGILAILASIDNARENSAQARLRAQALLVMHVQRYTLALLRSSYTIRAARDAIIESENPQALCERTLARLARLPASPARYVLFGAGDAPRCATQGFVPPRPPAADGEVGRVWVAPSGERLLVFLYDGAGRIEGIAEYPRDVIARVVNQPPAPENFALEIQQGNRVMALRTLDRRPTLRSEISDDFPFAGGDSTMRIRMAARPIALSEWIGILTPVLMWLWASLVGWLLVQRLLLGPLGRLQATVSGYKPGDRSLDLSRVSSPAREIGSLGQAFDRVIQTVARHEDDLEAAVDRQKRLVREVHHRVKNNLQVVASLLNLHSRGSRDEAVGAAYASIQRRVDALAVVHRNHYAELEENRGVALRPLISELASNLRATAPADAIGMQIRLDVAPLHAVQDVAVSVAFLVTEITEFGMLCGATQVSVVLEQDEPGSAMLTIQVDSLAGTPECDQALADRFERIVTGLARQLRSTLERDPEQGRYALRIAVVGGAVT